MGEGAECVVLSSGSRGTVGSTIAGVSTAFASLRTVTASADVSGMTSTFKSLGGQSTAGIDIWIDGVVSDSWSALDTLFVLSRGSLDDAGSGVWAVPTIEFSGRSVVFVISGVGMVGVGSGVGSSCINSSSVDSSGGAGVASGVGIKTGQGAATSSPVGVGFRERGVGDDARMVSNEKSRVAMGGMSESS